MTLDQIKASCHPFWIADGGAAAPETGACPYDGALRPELDGQERNDTERDGVRRKEDAREIPDAGPDDRRARLEEVRVDDRGDGGAAAPPGSRARRTNPRE